MLELITPRVWAEITSAAKAALKPSYAAVAYFGNSGHRLLPLCAGSSLVVNASIQTVESGGTCPESLAKLLERGVDIYSAKNLHAKIFAFDKVAFVGSSNASTSSEKFLVEATLRLEDRKVIASVREAVMSLCITKLSQSDLIELSKHYRPPKNRAEPKGQLKFSTLLMELKAEQGLGRETQVQPPKPVWIKYFEVDVDNGPIPSIRLRDDLSENGDMIVKIVKHHHNYTLELSGVGKDRPAILKMRKFGKNRYRYSVIRPSDPNFSAVETMLNTVDNPDWSGGRRWLVI